MHAACSPSGWKPATTCGDGVRWGTRSSWCAWPMAARPSSGWRSSWATCTRASCACAGAIHSVQEVGPVAPIEWSGALKPERCAENYCDYLLPRGLPLQSLRIDLADINTLAQVGVSGLVDATPASAPPPQFVPRNPLYALRHQQRRTNPLPSGPGEAPLLDTVVYRLAQAGGEARSPALALDGAVYSRLRLRTS